MNRVIKTLMLSDIFILTGFGLIDPIMAIFFKEHLIGGTVVAAGIAWAIFLTTKSIVQVPFSKYVDKHMKSMGWLIFGTFMIALVPFIYIFSTHIHHIYVAQVIHGIGSAIAYSTWLGIWSRNLDKNHESFEWSLYSTVSGLGTAITAFCGALIAQYVGFDYTFVMVGILSLAGCIVLMFAEYKSEEIYKLNLRNYHKRLPKRRLFRKGLI